MAQTTDGRGSRLRIRALLIALALLISLALPCGVQAASPVDWRSVGSSAEGEQWWDAGSLRVGRDGHLSVLSRFRSAPPQGAEPATARPGPSTLYVMELECDRARYRDVSIGGLPRFGAPWRAAQEDPLVAAVVAAACEAGAPLLASR